MNFVLIRKSISDAKWLFLSFGLLLFVFCWTRVWVVSLIETPRFTAILDQFWEQFGHFSPVSFSHLISYPGRVALTLAEPIVVFGISIWAIARGSDSVSGPLDRGTLEMLLAQPLSRIQALTTQAAVTTAGTALLCCLCWLGMSLGIQYTVVEVAPESAGLVIPFLDVELPNPFQDHQPIKVPLSNEVNPASLAPAVMNLFAMGFCVAGMATLVSSWDRYRWRTIGIISGFYIVEFLIKIVAMSAESLQWLRPLTFFSAFEPQWFVYITVEKPELTWSFFLFDDNGQIVEMGPSSYNLTLLGIGLISYLTAALIFHRRDLPAPL